MKNNNTGLVAPIAVLIAAVAQVACTCPKTALEQTAHVHDFWESRGDYCKFDFHLKGNSEEDDLKQLHLRRGYSTFKLKVRRMELAGNSASESSGSLPVNFLNVRWNIVSQIQDPDMRVFHDDKGPLEKDYCIDGGDLSQHVYALEFPDLPDTEVRCDDDLGGIGWEGGRLLGSSSLRQSSLSPRGG